MISEAKIKEWVEKYLRHVAEITPEVHVRDEEGYKFKAVDVFQRNFDIEAKNLVSMLDASIVNNNLVAGTWYFPRKMLLIFAEESPDEVKSALRILFDEKESAGKRIDKTEKVFNGLMAARNKKLDEEGHSFIGIRFLSLLLSYRYPEKYNAIKPREWKVFCKFVDSDYQLPRGISGGEQYDFIVPYIESLRQYIKGLEEITKIKNSLTAGLEFIDKEFRWMTQDVIFVTSRLFAKEAEREGVEVEEKFQIETEKEEKTSATTGNRFTYEEDLENFIIENLNDLEDLKIFEDKRGTIGRQYHTDFGDMDILATDDSGNFVVIELKRDRARPDIIGQIAKYMQWVEDHLARKDNKQVRGIIIAHRGDPALENAARALRFSVIIKYYKLGIIFSQN